MLGNLRNAYRNPNVCIVALGLVLALVAPIVAAAGPALGSTANSNATLEAFADGAVSKTIALSAGATADSSASLRLPADAVVSSASVDATLVGNSTATSGSLEVDVGADGKVDTTATVTVLGATKVVLPAEALNAALRAKAAASGAVDIALAVTAWAATGPCTLVLGNVHIEYSTAAAVSAKPAFTGEVSDLGVVAGEANASAADLAAHFSGAAGTSLTYSAEFASDAASASSGLLLQMNGSRVVLKATNPNFWGEVVVKFAAADAHGQVAFSNAVTVHVMPGKVDVPTTRTEAHARAEAIIVAGCGGSNALESFRIPADALVTSATMRLESGAGFSALGATIDVLAESETAVGLNASQLPKDIDLNTSALNARLDAKASSWGLVDLDLALAVCPLGGVAQITVTNVTVTYARGPAALLNASAQAIAAIVVNGNASSEVASDSSLTLALQTRAPLPSNATVEWYVDGRLVGTGRVLGDVILCQGEHTVEARAKSGLAVQVYATTVNASTRGFAEAVIAINGALTSTVKSGSALILELRTQARLDADTQVDWYVDGVFVGRGAVLGNVTLAPGSHSVEARATSGTSVRSYSTQVSAEPTAPPANFLTAALVSAGVIAGVGAMLLVRRLRRPSR